MASENVVNLTEASFQSEVLEAGGAVLVDFWAEWCGPCRMLAPVIDEIADMRPDNAKVCKLDVDAYGALAARYGVMSIPTVIIFRDGAEAARFVGAQPKDVFLKALA